MKCERLAPTVLVVGALLGLENPLTAAFIIHLLGNGGDMATVDPTRGTNGAVIPGSTATVNFSGAPGVPLTRTATFADPIDGITVTDWETTWAKVGLIIGPSTYAFAVFTPGPTFAMLPVSSFLSAIGGTTAQIPILSDSNGTSLFMATNLDAFQANTTSFTSGESFTITNGTSAQLPGFVFGTAAIGFSSIAGFVYISPYTGTAILDASVSAEAVPEPGPTKAFALLGWLVGVAWFRRTRPI